MSGKFTCLLAPSRKKFFFQIVLIHRLVGSMDVEPMNMVGQQYSLNLISQGVSFTYYTAMIASLISCDLK